MPTFTSPFTGTVVEPTDVSYYALDFSTNQMLYWPAVVNPTQVPAARIMDCTPSTAGLSIALPEANQGSVGTDVLIRNLGAASFTVTNFSGGAGVTVTAGTSIYFYLSNNTSSAGIWENVTFGAGTSSADAASLMSYGLTTIAGKLAVTGNIVQVSSAPSITDTSRAATFVWTGGSGTYTLPAGSSLSSGWFISFRNAGTGTLTIQTTSPALLNGVSSITTNPGDSGIILFDSGANRFFTVGWTAPNNVTFSSATYDMDSISGSSLSLVSNAPIIQTYVALSGTRTTNLTVTLPNITQLYVLINQSSSSAYSIIFGISGFSGAGTTVTLAANSVVTIVVDAGQMYSITQSTTSTFQALPGTVSLPGFSFTTDIHSGMYLVGTSKLGLSANSTNMMTLDGTNTSALQITTAAAFTATGGITGGTF
jgi:hypothetical protein